MLTFVEGDDEGFTSRARASGAGLERSTKMVACRSPGLCTHTFAVFMNAEMASGHLSFAAFTRPPTRARRLLIGRRRMLRSRNAHAREPPAGRIMEK